MKRYYILHCTHKHHKYSTYPTNLIERLTIYDTYDKYEYEYEYKYVVACIPHEGEDQQQVYLHDWMFFCRILNQREMLIFVYIFEILLEFILLQVVVNICITYYYPTTVFIHVFYLELSSCHSLA